MGGWRHNDCNKDVMGIKTTINYLVKQDDTTWDWGKGELWGREKDGECGGDMKMDIKQR